MIADRERRIKNLEQAILYLRSELQKTQAGQTSSISVTDGLDSYVSDLEASESQLRGIYQELMSKPLFLVQENQRLENELNQAREIEEELEDRLNELTSEFQDKEAQSQEVAKELQVAQEWLDEYQPAIHEIEKLREALATANERITKLEDMQGELLKQAEAAPVPAPAIPSKSSRRTSRRESEVMRQIGAKAIHRSIEVVEHVQNTVLELRERLLTSGSAKEEKLTQMEEEAFISEDDKRFADSIPVKRQEPVTEDVVVAEIKEDEMMPILDNANFLLQEELEKLKNTLLQEEIEKQNIEADLKRMVEEIKIDPLRVIPVAEEPEGEALDYETPKRGLPLPHEGAEGPYNHDYSEVDYPAGRKGSGLYEPVDFQGSRKQGKMA